MTQAFLIDGKAIAARVRADVAAEVARMKSQYGFQPGLAVVLVGEDPASKVYVRNKAEQTVEVGMASFEHKLAESTSEAELLALVAKLNADPAVHGILVQMPLPKHIDSVKVLEAIDPAKDVDGFHPMNVGKLSIGERALAPCTPVGSVILAKSVKHDLSGLDAVVIGRSNIVGKPMAQLLLRENCTVTIAHSRTKDLPGVVRRADLVIAAIGKPEFVKGDWIKPGAIVIDVGINRIVKPDGKGKLVGDVDFAEAAKVASAITPVPGGVGPMTIACLLKNTVEAAQMQRGLPPKPLDFGSRQSAVGSRVRSSRRGSA
jgi:methylenetetrahydrofolate dehydrogenase (NADP+)/methenyltetrahydrofolate cyclohydrolase